MCFLVWRKIARASASFGGFTKKILNETARLVPKLVVPTPSGMLLSLPDVLFCSYSCLLLSSSLAKKTPELPRVLGLSKK